MRKWALDLVVGVAAAVLAYAIAEVADVEPAALKWGVIFGAALITIGLAWWLGSRSEDAEAKGVSIFRRGTAGALKMDDITIDPQEDAPVSIADRARVKGKARFRNIWIGRKSR